MPTIDPNEHNPPKRRDPFNDDPVPIVKRERVSLFRRLMRRRFAIGILLLAATLFAYGYSKYLRMDRKEKAIARFEATGSHCHYAQKQSIGVIEDFFRKIFPQSYFDEVVRVEFGQVTDEAIEALSKLEFQKPIQALDFTGKEVSESCFEKISEIETLLAEHHHFSDPTELASVVN